jgi:hypothetical protein
MLSHSCPAGRRWNGYGRVGRGAGTEQGQDRGRVLFRGEPRITLLPDVTPAGSSVTSVPSMTLFPGWHCVYLSLLRLCNFFSVLQRGHKV